MQYCKWCGQEANYYFQTTNTYCCSKFPQQCPEFKKKLSEKKKGKKRSNESIEKQRQSMKGRNIKLFAKMVNTTKICDYGCGKVAKYKFKNGKYCCENDYRKCKGFIDKKVFKEKINPLAISIENNSNIICEYGCEELARYKFKNGKYCCSESVTKCPTVSRKMTLEAKRKLQLINKKPIEYWKKKYPFFSKIEELRYNPDKSGEKEIQVHCKNHNCPNSKEQDGWFTPSYVQLYERIRQLEHPEGNGGSHFYCSEECKNICPLYNFKYFEEQEMVKTYNPEEYQTFRENVLERDNYKCQYCGEPAEHIHHERPQKIEPFFALDPDLAWSVCKKCHYRYGHKDECSTGNLAILRC